MRSRCRPRRPASGTPTGPAAAHIGGTMSASELWGDYDGQYADYGDALKISCPCGNAFWADDGDDQCNVCGRHYRVERTCRIYVREAMVAPLPRAEGEGE